MSCNCNTASRTCDPCMFCTPPGVTGLTTCQPVDPCEEKIDACCVLYSGETNPCLPVTKGDKLCEVLHHLVVAYFGENCTTTTTTSTTSTTTTAPPTTTTTTTLAPCVCYTYVVQNITGYIQYIGYNNCNRVFQSGVPVPANSQITICVCNNEIYYNSKSIIVFQGGTGCNTTTTTSTTTSTSTTSTTSTTTTSTTTTTTTVNPCSNCRDYEIFNLSGGSVSGTYRQCVTGTVIPITLLNGQSTAVCACQNSVSIIPVPGLTIIDEGFCGTTTTSTTTTEPPCVCYQIGWVGSATNYLSYTNCYGEGVVTVNTPEVSLPLYICAIQGTVLATGLSVANVSSELCASDCITTTSTTTTSTTSAPAECATYDVTGGTGGGSWSAQLCGGTAEPIAGIVAQGVTIDTGCIVVGSLVLTNASSANEAMCTTPCVEYTLQTDGSLASIEYFQCGGSYTTVSFLTTITICTDGTGYTVTSGNVTLNNTTTCGL